MIKQPFIESNRNRMSSEGKAGVGIVLFLIALAIMFFVSPFTVIDTTEQGVVIRLGSLDRTLGEGVHWKTPFIEKVVKFDVTTKKVEVEGISAASNQTEKLAITAFRPSRFNPDDRQCQSTYLNDLVLLCVDWFENVIPVIYRLFEAVCRNHLLT